jgi:hypothetical protein
VTARTRFAASRPAVDLRSSKSFTRGQSWSTIAYHAESRIAFGGIMLLPEDPFERQAEARQGFGSRG